MNLKFEHFRFFVEPEFIRPSNVYRLSAQILSATQAERGGKCRFLARIIPIETIISAHDEVFEKELSEFVTRKITEFSECNDPKKVAPPKFAVEFSHRYIVAFSINIFYIAAGIN